MGECRTFELKIGGIEDAEFTRKSKQIFDDLVEVNITKREILSGAINLDGKKMLIFHIHEPFISYQSFKEFIVPRLVEKHGVSIVH